MAYGSPPDAEVRRGGDPRRWVRPAAGLAVVGALFAYVLTHRIDPSVEIQEVPRTTAALDGPRGTVPESVRVLVGGAAPASIDARTGTLSPLAGLSIQPDQEARLTPVPGGGVLALVVDDRSSKAVLLKGGAAQDLGAALQAVPLRDGGVMLLRQGNGRTTVELRGADGKAGGTWSVRGLVTALRDTAGGLLVSRVLSTGTAGGELALVDPRTGKDRRKVADGRDVLTVTDAAVVSVPGDCRENCAVSVTPLTTGKERKLPVVRGAAPQAAALTTDGELLAVSVPSDYVNGGVPRAGFVTVFDLVDGTSRALPGVRPATGQHAGVSWAPGGDLLTVAVWRGNRAWIGFWSPARPAEPPTVLPAEPPSSPGSALATTDA